MSKIEVLKKKEKDWHVLEFFVPIKEAAAVGNDFFIKGMAINETVTRNGVKYIATELEKAAPSFRNKPILLDHENKVMNTVGRTTENVNFSHEKHGIEFEAKIMDSKIKEMINDGRITDVSIGAKVQDLIQNKDDESVTAIGMEGLEISLVAVPGDPGANIGAAFEESFMIKESMEKKEDIIINNVKGGNKEEMAEEETKTPEETPEVKASEEVPAVEPAVAEEKTSITNVNVDMSAISEMTKSMEAMRGEIAALKKVKEEDETPVEPEAPKAEPTDETVGAVGAEAPAEEDTSEGHIVEKAESGKGYQIWRDNSQSETLLKFAR